MRIFCINNNELLLFKYYSSSSLSNDKRLGFNGVSFFFFGFNADLLSEELFTVPSDFRLVGFWNNILPSGGPLSSLSEKIDGYQITNDIWTPESSIFPPQSSSPAVET